MFIFAFVVVPRVCISGLRHRAPNPEIIMRFPVAVKKEKGKKNVRFDTLFHLIKEPEPEAEEISKFKCLEEGLSNWIQLSIQYNTWQFKKFRA